MRYPVGVGEDFRIFCNSLIVDTRSTIASRNKTITKRLNADFYGTQSDTANRFYSGSYGRGTAIRGVSDVDLMFILPYEIYDQYNSRARLSQSALLQAVKRSIQTTYPATDISADGQVAVVNFFDGMTFEVVPCFRNNDGSYTYPDASRGGRWRLTNPKPEIAAVKALNTECNNSLKLLCRMARRWRDVYNVRMGGMLIDTLAYNFLRDWGYRSDSFLFYPWMSRDFFAYLANQNLFQEYWSAPGSGQRVYKKATFQHKAKRSFNIACDAIDAAMSNHTWKSRLKWRQIYGSTYPSR